MSTEVIGLDPAAALDLVEKWHDAGLDQLTLIYDAAVPGNTLKLNGVETEITEDIAKGMRLAFSIAIAALGVLPFGLEEEEEEEMGELEVEDDADV